ncbi:MAG: hypothetical protein EOO40_10750, partial [Deltaproteobacteria bacterium]
MPIPEPTASATSLETFCWRRLLTSQHTQARSRPCADRPPWSAPIQTRTIVLPRVMPRKFSIGRHPDGDAVNSERNQLRQKIEARRLTRSDSAPPGAIPDDVKAHLRHMLTHGFGAETIDVLFGVSAGRLDGWDQDDRRALGRRAAMITIFVNDGYQQLSQLDILVHLLNQPSHHDAVRDRMLVGIGLSPRRVLADFESWRRAARSGRRSAPPRACNRRPCSGRTAVLRRPLRPRHRAPSPSRLSTWANQSSRARATAACGVGWVPQDSELETHDSCEAWMLALF